MELDPVPMSVGMEVENEDFGMYTYVARPSETWNLRSTVDCMIRALDDCLFISFLGTSEIHSGIGVYAASDCFRLWISNSLYKKESHHQHLEQR